MRSIREHCIKYKLLTDTDFVKYQLQLDIGLDEQTKQNFDGYLQEDYQMSEDSKPKNCAKNCAPVRIGVEEVEYALYTHCTNLDFLQRMRREDKKLFIKQMGQWSVM